MAKFEISLILALNLKQFLTIKKDEHQNFYSNIICPSIM